MQFSSKPTAGHWPLYLLQEVGWGQHCFNAEAITEKTECRLHKLHVGFAM
jgi:hypothetical protein